MQRWALVLWALGDRMRFARFVDSCNTFATAGEVLAQASEDEGDDDLAMMSCGFREASLLVGIYSSSELCVYSSL